MIDGAESGWHQFTKMRLKNYKADLNQRLRDPEYAAEYLAQVLAENDGAAFLLALKDVVEAGGRPDVRWWLR